MCVFFYVSLWMGGGLLGKHESFRDWSTVFVGFVGFDAFVLLFVTRIGARPAHRSGSIAQPADWSWTRFSFNLI